MSDLLNERHVKSTRKPHRCAYCGKDIPTGSPALNEYGICDNRSFSRYACEECQPLLGDFSRYIGDDYCTDLEEAFAHFMEERCHER